MNSLKKIKEWYTDITEWKSWDAPWEEIEYNEEKQRMYRKHSGLTHLHLLMSRNKWTVSA